MELSHNCFLRSSKLNLAKKFVLKHSVYSSYKSTNNIEFEYISFPSKFSLTKSMLRVSIAHSQSQQKKFSLIFGGPYFSPSSLSPNFLQCNVSIQKIALLLEPPLLYYHNL